ncbi:MAG: GNAT family N-acetyltransferase [Spirochaetota bacterium]
MSAGLRIRDIDPRRREEFARCAEIASDSEIGRRYGFSAPVLAEKMSAALAAGAIIVVAEESLGSGAESAASGRITGFAWVDPRGAFGSSPYLKLIAVDSAYRGGGAGALLLGEYEKRTADIGRVWTLLVSDFNERAAEFYLRHGYEKAGLLPDFAKPGIGEVVMIKRRET